MARREGLTRARVTQLLQLLELDPAALHEIAALVRRGVKVSERSLRPLIGRPAREQLRALRRRQG